MSQPRVAIVDDHTLVRDGLAAILRQRIGATIIWQGQELEEVLALDPPPDLLLLDLDLGGRTADPKLAGSLQAAGCRVVVVSAMADPRQVKAMMDAKVSGFVSKREDPDALVAAIEEVLHDGFWTSPELAGLMLTSLQRPQLSPAQLNVLRMYASGMTLDAVARHLGISLGTANTHLKRARAKYAEVGRPAPSRVDLYREVLQDGLIAR